MFHSRERLLTVLREAHPGINRDTQTEYHWSTLSILYRANLRATYVNYKPRREGDTYLEIEGREYSDIDKWAGEGEGIFFVAYFPKANVAVMDRNVVG